MNCKDNSSLLLEHGIFCLLRMVTNVIQSMMKLLVLFSICYRNVVSLYLSNYIWLYTLTQGIQFWGLQFIGDYNLNLCSKYSSLTAMLICSMIMIFQLNFFSIYDLKMSKMGRQLTFPYLYQGVSK